jgi:tRNA 2-selenouridine synthase
MGNQILGVHDYMQLYESHILVDVRSPGEFEKGHIPSALSCPLFSNDERALIGTLYKQKGREKAMLEALNYYSLNVKKIIEQLIALHKKKPELRNHPVLVYCWRGGMRSGTVCWMLNLFGYKTIQLRGGYKSFRRLALQTFEQRFPFIILGGKTGSAKTEILTEMKQTGAQVINLEQLAHHRGSAFGSLGQERVPTQEYFENLLCIELLRMKLDAPVWLEDESQRIGAVTIPNSIWKQMRESDVIYLDIPVEERLKNILNDYGRFSSEALKDCTIRLQKRLGGLLTKQCTTYLTEGNYAEAFAILLHYYDKTYRESTAKRDPSKVHQLKTDTGNAQHNVNLIMNFLHEWKLQADSI